jgi:hypothetical protein
MNRYLYLENSYLTISPKKVHGKICYNKYMNGKTLSPVQVKPTYSHFLEGAYGGEGCVLSVFFCCGRCHNKCLWEDAWLGDSLLANQYLSLYNIFRAKDVTLADVLSRSPLDIRFTRALRGDKLDSWVSMFQKLMG